MAEDFYTMQEVMEKLRKSEQEVQDLVKQGKLRQYMDAGNAMFKTDDVNELAEEIVGLDVSSLGIDLTASEMDLDLGETSETLDLDESALELAETSAEPTDELKLEETAAEPPVDLDASELDLASTSADDVLDLGGSELELAETSAEAKSPQESELDLAGLDLGEDLSQPSDPDIAGIGDSILELAETSEIELEADDSQPGDKADTESIELKDQTSEGGFGLSQMGDLTMADTNVGTVGINILSGTEDSFKLTEDTKADTLSADIDDIDELESLDADSNMESFGSGSGLLDLSLQADDTSLGAVLDDILPAGADEAGGGDLPIDEIGADAADDLLAEPAMAVEEAAPAAMPAAAAGAPAGAAQMVAIAPVDPRTNLFGIAMFLPLAAIIIVGIILTAAIQGVNPSLLKMLTKTEIAGVGLFWYILGGLAVFAILFSLFASVGGGGGGAAKTRKTKTKKEKKPKAKKEKKPKAKKEKKPKKKK